MGGFSLSSVLVVLQTQDRLLRQVLMLIALAYTLSDPTTRYCRTHATVEFGSYRNVEDGYSAAFGIIVEVHVATDLLIGPLDPK